MNFRMTFIAAALASLLMFSVPALAITPNHVDDFNSSTTNNLGWGAPFGATQSAIVLDGGQGGAGDNSLEISFSNRSVVTNSASTGGGQWDGDWTAAGITSVTLDVFSPSTNSSNLTLWLGIADGNVNQAGDVYVTSQSQSVPSDDAWHSISFDVTAADWTDINGNDINIALQSVDQFRIIHNPNQSFVGDNGLDGFVVDNIAAAAVPEPTTGSLLALICGAVAWRCRRV